MLLIQFLSPLVIYYAWKAKHGHRSRDNDIQDLEDDITTNDPMGKSYWMTVVLGAIQKLSNQKDGWVG